MQDQNTPQRFPVTDEVDDSPFVNAGENEDIVQEHEDTYFEEQEKEMEKINNHFDRVNEQTYNEAR